MRYGTLVRAGPLLLLGLSTGCDGQEIDEPARPTCNYHGDCENGAVCFDGECFPTASCIERAHCAQVPVCENDRCICDQDINRCLPVCVTDDDCPSDGHCLDGVCTPYPVTFDAPAPESGPRGRLMVGFARVPLDFPMGVSMAGYGSRLGPRTPYQDSLGGSNAWFDRPDVRAVVLSDGKETVVLLRIPTSWSTDFMLADTARKVQERTGVNVLHNLITSANHSHSLPARWWHLVKGLGFGFFGYGEWNFEIFDRMTTSYADAVELAMNDMQPGRFGYTVLDDFDPENRIHRDRRKRNNNLPGYMKKDDRMVLMRIDDENGDPLIVMTNFGMHGTIFDYDNPILTGDAGAGVETLLGEFASEKYGHPVMGLYLQGNAGDISPAGDDRGHRNTEKIQLIGRRAWRVMEPHLDAIETSDQIEVRVISRRVPISHALLGYGEGEFYDADVSCENSADYFRYGAFQCVEGYHDDDDPGTAFSDGDLACVFGVECLTGGHPVPQFQKTSLSVLRLGTLALATMPGEPLSQFGRDLSDRIREAVPGVTDAAVLGYSQDHHFYLLNEDDWLQGGYEPSRDIWGWRLGPFLTDHSVRLAGELAKEPEDRMFEATGNTKPMYWVDPEDERQPVPFTETEGDPARIVEDVPEQIERLQEVTLAWAGGHPGLDQPIVTLETDPGTGTFEPVKKPGDLIYDDSAFEMMVEYEGDCGRRNCDAHQWRVRWQERRDFPTGRYRLSVTGRAFKGGDVVTYETGSRPFEIRPTSHLRVYGLSATDDGIEGRVVDPPAVRLVEDGEERIAEPSGFLLRSEMTPSHVGGALPAGAEVQIDGLIRPPGGSAEPLFGTAVLEHVVEPRRRLAGYDAAGAPKWADAGEQPAARFLLNTGLVGPSGDYYLELTVTDAVGNSGTVTATITR